MKTKKERADKLMGLLYVGIAFVVVIGLIVSLSSCSEQTQVKEVQQEAKSISWETVSVEDKTIRHYYFAPDVTGYTEDDLTNPPPYLWFNITEIYDGKRCDITFSNLGDEDHYFSLSANFYDQDDKLLSETEQETKFIKPKETASFSFLNDKAAFCRHKLGVLSAEGRDEIKRKN
jgi:hypothetical protein